MTSRPTLRRAICGGIVAAALTIGAIALSSGAASAAPRSAWDSIAQCESGGNWHIDTGNGYYGGLQFSPATWAAYGGRGSAANASRAQQIAIGLRVVARQGWSAWPACSAAIGLHGRIIAASARESTASASTTSWCRNGQLKATFHLKGAAGGTRYAVVVLRNTSTTRCALRGTPSVRFVADKRAVGAAGSYGAWVARDGKVHRSSVKLAARTGRAYLRVGIADAADFASSCRAVTADALRLRLPHAGPKHDLVPVPLRATTLQVCANKHDAQLTVSHFTATAHGV